MIKLVINLTKAIVVTLVAVLFGSCNMNMNLGGLKKVEGNGNVMTKSRDVSDFTSVSASNGLEVILVQGPTSEIKVEADENLHQHIKTEVNEGELKIFTDANLRNAKEKKVYVQLAKLNTLESSSGASVTSKNAFDNTSMNVSSSSGSEIDLKVNVASLNCQSSSGSEIKVSGKADKLDTESSSGSSIDAKQLTTKTAFADSSSGSSIDLQSPETLTAEASSGSSISYETEPKTLQKKASSGGSIGRD
ncbi:head GIN domain-containing protein [Flavobacterium sp.]|uniref:head GIN domain-containing protein n=1 Tax=Flavobacterium sp. TaxID=239 RepID=UPI0028BEAF1A|nr:head GIN domain-containing protein [Flavobacterium sp.]